MELNTSCNKNKDVLPFTVGRERTSLMLSQLVSSPICNVIFVIFTLTSDPRLMMRDCRQTSGKDVFNVVTTCVQSHL
jgi:hypothetical protein